MLLACLHIHAYLGNPNETQPVPADNNNNNNNVVVTIHQPPEMSEFSSFPLRNNQ
jgi:hypothetical protein